MRYLARIIAMLGISLLSLLAARPVLATPPLPSSFHGIVKVNSANVPDGTLIKALINGRAYAEKHSQTIQGDSMYLLNILGDDLETTVVEGGREGDTIVFSIGGVKADQTGLWKSGTNVALNLSASTSATLIAPQNTTTRMPTQTEISVETSAMATTKTELQATQTIPSEINPENTPANFSLTSVVVGIIIAVSILFALGWIFLVRKQKALK